ncbi:flagellar filament capping protein FliD [Caldibacillus sp. 210928-DFI.2.22]|uniref:flagellar filament capping protein FliD n=1 Tax=unclassified Caldibacillus TaxID=2641266 RepID=UPI001D075B60|nr:MULTISPECIES: flagellar filament capping protein FliD [unclassified Caldibacillus]MCB7070866.1 flagellar filament capping protein FliD [Caldibacillus sp. 210928-DFI.2.22]MCB7074360.1 flagellar filament capping protein FliD [Caldibacillus sp. 210928-DFI.2.18]
MVMRVTGLASGMNIDEIVENMMKAQSIPLNKIKQQKTLLEWQRDSYREMNTLLLDFRSQLTNMKLSSFYRTRSIASTNEDIVSATVASGAGQSSYTISKISSLAVAESRMTNSGISKLSSNKVDTTKSLFSIQDAFAKEITWKQGSVESKSIVTKEGEPITLGLADGVKITDVKNMTVEVNGIKYTVIDSGTPKSGEVMVNKDTGELTFGDTIAANSTVKVNYVTDKKVENKTITKDTTQIQLKGALVAGQIKLSFKDGTDTTIELSDKPIEDNSKIGQIIDKDGNKFGEINYETGVITFNSEFSKYFPAETENSKEKPKLELTITSQQNYFSFGLTTHTSKGKIDEKFLIQGSESLNSVMSKVNNSKLGVTMFYDSYSDKVTMTRKETGVYNNSENGKEIEFAGGDFLTQVLGFQNGDSGNYVKAENATFIINGLETSRQSNTFSMNGVTFTLKKTTDTPVTINVNNDNDKLYENIKNFVDKYNELVEKIEKKLSEPKYKDYLPLTDDEKEELSETQQEKWENMAKSGILRNDSILSGLITQMRTAIYSAVNQDDLDSAMKSLSAIGITTTADFTTAKLEINESKLKAAIEKDPNSIELLFNGTGATDGQKGVIQRLYDKVNATMDQLKERAGNSYSVNNQFTIGRQLDDLDDRIERFEDRLADLETRYYSQFTAMEQAIQKANSQAAYLAQFFQ